MTAYLPAALIVVSYLVLVVGLIADTRSFLATTAPPDPGVADTTDKTTGPLL